MKVITNSQTNSFSNSPTCTGFEFPFGDKDINIAIVTINGRYPDKGLIVNEVCKEIAYVLNGTGSIGIDQETYQLNPGDAVLISPGEKFYWQGDKRWVLDNLNSVTNNFSAEIDIVNLLALSIEQIEERLSNKDVIFVIGGDTDYLMSVYQKTGFDKLLLKLLETKVYVGSSAGPMVMGKRISAAAYKLIYGEDSKYDIEDYLGLVNFSVMPHLDSPHFPNRKESLIDAVGNFEGKVYGLRDDSAVVVDGNNIYTTGSEPIVIENGMLIVQCNQVVHG